MTRSLTAVTQCGLSVLIQFQHLIQGGICLFVCFQRYGVHSVWTFDNVFILSFSQECVFSPPPPHSPCLLFYTCRWSDWSLVRLVNTPTVLASGHKVKENICWRERRMGVKGGAKGGGGGPATVWERDRMRTGASSLGFSRNKIPWKRFRGWQHLREWVKLKKELEEERK